MLQSKIEEAHREGTPLSEDTPPHGTGPRPSPEPPPDSRLADPFLKDEGDFRARGSVSVMVPYMVEVATYLGAAALGGIIGNRADAGTVATVQRMFKAIRDRRQERNTDDNAPLTREEAIEAATAAVLSQSLPVPASTDLRATRRPDGSWEITFYEDFANPVMVVTVPPGDLGRATIVVRVDSTYEHRHRADSSP